MRLVGTTKSGAGSHRPRHQSSVKILLMVNASPWGASLGATALRFARAACGEGHAVPAVYFRGDGVYQAQAGGQADHGAEHLADAWAEFAHTHDTALLLCAAAGARRFSAAQAEALVPPWRLAGLAEWVDWLERTDRVVGF